MGEMLEWWLSGGDWADFKQNRRIQDLEQAHANEVAAVRSSVSRQTSALDSRLERLERALFAFVELEDTRAELNAFADAAAARRFARDLANRLLGADAPSVAPTPPADLPGYWLSPAVRALLADLYPGAGDPRALRAEARARDDERAELFDLCIGAIGGQEHDLAQGVERWLPRRVEVGSSQRAVATEVARGRFGPDARATLVARLVEIRDAHPADEVARLVLPEFAAAVPTRGAEVDQSRPAAGRAATGLAELAELVSPSDEPVPAARPALHDDPLAELLAVLISEGAPGETPVLQRMAAIRTSLAAVGVPAPPPMQTASDAAGTVWAMLREWLADRGAGSAHAVACAVLAPIVTQLADALASAAATPSPATRAFTIAGTTAVVGPDGARDTAWRSHVASTVSEPPGWVLPTAAVAGVLAVAGAVLGAVVAPGLWAVGAIAAVGAAAAWIWHGRARAAARQERAAAVADAERRIAAHAGALADEQAAATARATVAGQARATIAAACATSLAGVPA
jgi:hypothetical protein